MKREIENLKLEQQDKEVMNDEHNWKYNKDNQINLQKLKMPSCPTPPESHVYPNTGSCEWVCDEDTKVIYANFFCNTDDIDEEDKEFLHLLMEKAYLTVVTQGLSSEVSSNICNHFLGIEVSKQEINFDSVVKMVDNRKQAQNHAMKISEHMKHATLHGKSNNYNILNESGSQAIGDSGMVTAEGIVVDTTKDKWYAIDINLREHIKNRFENFVSQHGLFIIGAGSMCLTSNVRQFDLCCSAFLSLLQVPLTNCSTLFFVNNVDPFLKHQHDFSRNGATVLMGPPGCHTDWHEDVSVFTVSSKHRAACMFVVGPDSNHFFLFFTLGKWDYGCWSFVPH